MKKQELQIPEPCDASWEQMRGDEKSRFCSHCTKDVHNLSMLTKDEATALLEQKDRQLCVQYTHNSDGEVMFRDDKEPSWRLFSQKQGLKLLLSAAALAVPMLLGACDEPAQVEPAEAIATSPIKLEDGKAASLNLSSSSTVEVGSGRAPAPPTQPAQEEETKPACDGEPIPAQEPEEFMMLKGDIAEPDEHQEPVPKMKVEPKAPKLKELTIEPRKYHRIAGGLRHEPALAPAPKPVSKPHQLK